MDNNEKKARVKEELDVLDGVINYADKMIYEEGKRGEYGPLRRHAYGKTVVIETENEGRLTFRLSSTSAVYPKYHSGYATPHSPVGRLCAFLKEGNEGETPRWGEYTVLEVRLFDRFDGTQFEPNVRNFLRMDVRKNSKRDSVSNLRAFLTGMNAIPRQAEAQPTKQTPEEKPPEPIELLQHPPSVVEEIAPPPLQEMQLTEYAVVEDDETDEWIPPEQEDGNEDEEAKPAVIDEYFGLSESFYLNRTREQDAVVARSPIGAMYVEGVAGSGKTSAALGRTKMLCDFNAQNVYDEAEFRDIVGDNGDYWAGRFAGQFSQESSVGFVRTGELIQYLKETCRRLDLPNLPVQEYPELRSRLRQSRQVERSRAGSNRWAGLNEPRGTHVDTTMIWLRTADRAIASYWADAFLHQFPTAEDVANAFVPEEKNRALNIVYPAMERLHKEITSLYQELAKPRVTDRFALDGLAKRIHDCIQPIRLEILGSNTLWITIGKRFWSAQTERELAQALITDKTALYLKSLARLVFFDAKGMVDDGLSILSKTGEELPSDQVTRKLLASTQCLVRDNASGEILAAVVSDAEDLYIRLLPESAQGLYIQQDSNLKRLRVQRGLGRLQLPVITAAAKNIESESDEEPPAEVVKAQQRRSVQAAFTSVVRRTLLQPLAFVADAYAVALAVNASLFPDTELAAQIVEQLNHKKLADEDIDLLLCLYHLIGRGFDGNPEQLRTPSFYQSVFVDEVQDFTEQQVYLMVEQARPEYFAVTVVGDIAQKLHNGSSIDVRACFPGRNPQNVQLSKNMRQAEVPGIAWFSARFRAELQDGHLGEIPDDELLHCLLENPAELYGPVLETYSDETELVEQTVKLLQAARPKQTAAVILPSTEMANHFHAACKSALAEHMVDAEVSERIDLSRRHVRHFTAITNAKGLEFDLVILPYFEQYNLTDTQYLNRMYVALTRARQRLVLIGHVDRPTSAFDRVWQQYQGILAMIDS